MDRVGYEGVNLFECQQCRGHLIEKHRLATVKQRHEYQLEELFREVTTVSGNESSNDSIHEIRCPRCNNRMDKHQVRGPFKFKIDECRNCRFVWLDGSELAKIQIAHESKEQTIEIRGIQSRLAKMTASEREAYEARIANLVDRGGPMADATRQAMIELTFWYYLFGL